MLSGSLGGRICNVTAVRWSLICFLLVSLFQNYREEAATAMSYGREQLEVLKRQAILGRLYPSGKSVMEQL